MIKIIEGPVQLGRTAHSTTKEEIQCLRGNPVFELAADQVLIVRCCTMADDEYSTFFEVTTREHYEEKIEPYFDKEDIRLDAGNVIYIEYSD